MNTVFKFFLLHIAFVSTVYSNGNTCPKAQVGYNYTFQGVLEHTIDAPLKIAWIKDGYDVSHCIPGLECSDTNEENTTTTLFFLGNSSYEFKLVVHQITKEDAGLWSLVYFGPAKNKHNAPIFVCQLNLKVENVSEVETKPPEQSLDKRTTLLKLTNGWEEEKTILFSVLLGFILLGLLLFILFSLFGFLVLKASSPYKRVAEAKEFNKKHPALKKETSTHTANIVFRAWSKISHQIAKILKCKKKTTNMADKHNKYVTIERV